MYRYTSGSCNSGFKTFFPGLRLVYLLSLGEATPLGGTLTLTTCGATRNNTVLYVGTGCPTWQLPFGCIVGSDDASAPACVANAFASTLSLTATQRVYFVQLGGYNGQIITSGLNWTYTAASRSTSGTASRSRSRSRSATRSRTRKPK